MRSSNWLIDRNTKSDWAWLGAILFVPVAFAGLYVIRTRVSEVPAVQLSQVGWPVAQPSDTSDQAAALAAREALIRARESIIPTDIPAGEEFEEGSIRRVLSSRQEIAWRKDYVEKNEELINRVIEASKARSCSVSDTSGDGISNEQLIYLADFLTIAGSVNTYSGNLNRSLECYLAALRVLGHAHRSTSMWSGDFRLDELGLILAGLREWSLHEAQTSGRLLQAIEQLNRVLPTTPRQWSAALSGSGYLPPLPSRERDYRILRERILGQREPSYSRRPDGRFHSRIANELPFERKRALRILDHIEQSEWNSGGKQLLATIDGNWVTEKDKEEYAEGIIARELRRAISYFDRIEQGLSSFESQQLLPQPWSWLSTTYFLAYEYDGRTSFRQFLQNFADYYAEERALKLQFALLAYRIDHGTYPPELEALLPQYLLEMPLDPYSGDEFEYEPDGLPGELTAWHRGRMRNTLPPNTPFFWSVGHTYARLQGSTTTVPISEQDQDDPSLWKKRWVYRLDAGHNILEAPLVFPLPPIPAKDSEDTQ